MAVSRCNEIVISRKKFSEFDLVDPSTREECENLYLAGYTEDVYGERKNVKLKAMSFINASLGSIVGTLDPDTPNEAISIVNEKVGGRNAKIAVLNYKNTNFIQINKVDKKLFFNIDGKDYLLIRLSPNALLGSVIRVYLPNFPQNAGVMLLPTPTLAAKDDTAREVFYNDGVLSQAASDYYFTLIQLADPQDLNAINIVPKTKVIEVNIITTDN